MHHGTCKHFNGLAHHETCTAGVRFRDVTPEPDNREGSALRIPCHRLPILPMTPGQREHWDRRGTCPKYEEPTAAEIAGFEADTDAMVARMMKTLDVTAEVKREHKGRNWKGTKPCPVCGGVLHMTHAAYNGHVWGRCETEDCVSWME